MDVNLTNGVVALHKYYNIFQSTPPPLKASVSVTAVYFEDVLGFVRIVNWRQQVTSASLPTFTRSGDINRGVADKNRRHCDLPNSTLCDCRRPAAAGPEGFVQCPGFFRRPSEGEG
jgi:hypothetical protein